MTDDVAYVHVYKALDVQRRLVEPVLVDLSEMVKQHERLIGTGENNIHNAKVYTTNSSFDCMCVFVFPPVILSLPSSLTDACFSVSHRLPMTEGVDLKPMQVRTYAHI